MICSSRRHISDSVTVDFWFGNRTILHSPPTVRKADTVVGHRQPDLAVDHSQVNPSRIRIGMPAVSLPNTRTEFVAYSASRYERVP